MTQNSDIALLQLGRLAGVRSRADLSAPVSFPLKVSQRELYAAKPDYIKSLADLSPAASPSVSRDEGFRSRCGR